MNIIKLEDRFKSERDYLKKLNIAKEIIELFRDDSDEEIISPYYKYIIKNAHYPNWEQVRALALFREGTLNYKRSKFEIALEYLIESASIYYEFRDTVFYAKVMNNLATLYTATNQENKALEIYKKIIQSAPQNSSIIINYANLILRRGQADEALNLLTKAYNYTQQSDDKQELFSVVVELSNYYNNQAEPQKSLDILLPIIEDSKEITARTSVFAYLNIAEAYSQLLDNNHAIEYLQRAIDISQESALDEILWFSYLEAIKIYKTAKNWEKALHYSELRQALTEKIYLSKLNDKMEEIESGRKNKLSQYSNISYNEKTIRMASLGVMASGITHEINQPLNAIMIDAQAMIYKDDEEKVLPIGYRERIEYIIKATERISKIVNHIRYYWRHKNAIEKQELDVNEVISLAVSYLEQQIKSHQIVLKLIFIPRRLLVYGSQISLEQIIINLITNSVQALDSVSHNEKRIIVTTSVEEDLAVIQIDDNGEGIPPEIAENIFEPFVSSKEENFGTGLGLTLVKNFSKDLNAQVTHSKNKFGGCKFTIKIPLLDSIEEKG